MQGKVFGPVRPGDDGVGLPPAEPGVHAHAEQGGGGGCGTECRLGGVDDQGAAGERPPGPRRLGVLLILGRDPAVEPEKQAAFLPCSLGPSSPFRFGGHHLRGTGAPGVGVPGVE
jgi:hypothetical protein